MEFLPCANCFVCACGVLSLWFVRESRALFLWMTDLGVPRATVPWRMDDTAPLAFVQTLGRPGHCLSCL